MAKAKKEPGLITLETPYTGSGGGLAVAPISSLASGGRQFDHNQRYIGDRLRTDLTIQMAVAAKGEHGFHLSQTLTQRAVNRFDEYVEYDRKVIDRQRDNDDDQADVAVFCKAMRQAQATSLQAIRQGAINKIEEIVLTPLDPPQDRQEEVVIEQRPGLLGALFGGTTVTTVKR